MKAMRALLISATVLLAALASFPADAGGVRFGVAIGIPGPWYYPAPYYYPPYYPPAYAYPPVVVQQQAPAYVDGVLVLLRRRQGLLPLCEGLPGRLATSGRRAASAAARTVSRRTPSPTLR
jgi:hypothetical protein